MTVFTIIMLLFMIESLYAQNNICAGTTKPACARRSGECKEEKGFCPGHWKKSRRFCNQSPTCACCITKPDCAGTTKPACARRRGECKEENGFCPGHWKKGKRFCKQSPTCACCIPKPDTAQCSPSCVHGVCTNTNQCLCHEGWTGNICQTAVCRPHCVHGDCIIPNSCKCQPGWEGNHCQTHSVSPPSGSCSCGIANTANRIIGGSEVDHPQKYPWVVGLQMPADDVSCGGSIINSRYILTAAHCFYSGFPTCKYNPPNLLNILIGYHSQHNTGDNDLENTYKISMKRHIIHPDYICKTDDNDFALIEMSEDIILNDIIKPVCLPEDDSKTYESEIATAAGWGVKDDGKISSILLEVDLPILDTNCGGYTALYTTVNMLCAGYLATGGKDACVGDSGGPLVVQEGSKYVQVGVVSFGYMCALKGHPGVYGRVSKVLDWIKSESADGQSCTN